MSETKLPVRVGDTVAGKYVVERVVGEGGMGVVVRAMHRSLDQRVAIKFLLAEARAVTGVTERFYNEAKAAARLKSEHVARVLDVDQLPDGTPFMVMEYLEGKDLSEVLTERKKLPVDEACTYLLQACEAIAEAHAKGIVHRDIKPGNLFVAKGADGQGAVKVLDFGISKIEGRGQKNLSLTKTSAVLGSPLYMPPEQMSSSRDVDARADVWALGVVLYELLTGRLPFEGETLTGLVASIVRDPPKPVRETGTTVPDDLEALIMRCLEKDPQARVATIGELANGLAPFAVSSAAPSIDRISRIERSNPSLIPPASQPASLAVVPESTREDATKFSAQTEAGKSAAQTVATWASGERKAPPRKWIWIGAAASAALLGVAAVGVGSRAEHVHHAVGASAHASPRVTAATAAPTSSAPPEEPPSGAETSAAAPPPTFNAASPSLPVGSSGSKPLIPRGHAAKPEATPPPPPPVIATPPVHGPPPPPPAPKNSLDMEPK